MKKAFSLIELIVVVAIIGILAGVLFSSFSGGTESARAAKCLNNMRNLAQGAISYAMKTDYYPAAGSFAYIELDKSKGQTVYRERRGWISWLSTSDPYHTYRNTDTLVTSFQSVPNAASCCSQLEDALFAITNGVIWTAVNKNRETYVCPLHQKIAKDRGKNAPNWSYAMNAYFGYDSTKGSDVSSSGWIHPTETRLDRKLLFAEIPFGVTGASDGSYDVSEDTIYATGNDNYASDCVLQYKATVNGNGYNTDWSGTPEAIAFNHKSGKRDYYAHVVFADGHTEKLHKAKGSGGLKDTELTALLCEGVDVSFDGSSYKLVTDGDEND